MWKAKCIKVKLADIMAGELKNKVEVHFTPCLYSPLCPVLVCVSMHVTSSSDYESLPVVSTRPNELSKSAKILIQLPDPLAYRMTFLLASCLGNRVYMGGVSLLKPAKLGVRLVVGEGDVVVVGCAVAKGCVGAIY